MDVRRRRMALRAFCSSVPVSVTSNTQTRVSQALVINKGLLTVTLVNQPLYARNGTWQGWVRHPSDLRVGMELFQPDSQSWIPIYSPETLVRSFRVYDLVTEPHNNFIVNGVLADYK